jgi:fatty acid desaturase
MSTAMSTKHFVSSREPARTGTNAISLVALFGGLALLVLGIALGQAWMAIVGFVPFITAALYFNGMFWAKIIDSSGWNMTRESMMRKYY